MKQLKQPTGLFIRLLRCSNSYIRILDFINVVSSKAFHLE